MIRGAGWTPARDVGGMFHVEQTPPAGSRAPVHGRWPAGVAVAGRA